MNFAGIPGLTGFGTQDPIAIDDMKNDNIQKAIDNLKHFIKGSFPKNPTVPS
jgi:hypothetical protein